jgi:CTP synthase (UTP-ammonia lyase)
MITRIRVLGDRNLAYPSHRELDAALALFPSGIAAAWTASDAPGAADLRGVDGLWFAPGSPYRNDDAVLAALRAAREGGVPVLATCGGFQYALLELARNAAGIAGAQHAEVSPEGAQLVVAPLSCSLFGQVRRIRPVPGTRFASIVGEVRFDGTHYCSFGANAGYLPRLREVGLIEAAHADDAWLEAFELRGHPFFFGTLFQPQIGASRGGPLHPLIRAFLKAAAEAPQRGSATGAADARGAPTATLRAGP